MTLPEATEAIKRKTYFDPELSKDNPITVLSGGIPKSGHMDDVPALFNTKEMAVKEWLRSVFETINPDPFSPRFRFVDGPFMDVYHITVTDSHFSHRIVQERYSVNSKIVFKHGWFD